MMHVQPHLNSQDSENAEHQMNPNDEENGAPIGALGNSFEA